MAVILALFWVSLLIPVIDSNAAGEFSILYSPDSLKFSGSGKTLESLLKEVISACLGLSVDEDTEWKGLYVTDPFNTPEAVVEVYVDGVSSLGGSTGVKTFPLTVDEYEPDIYEAVKHRIKQRYIFGGNKLVDIKLSDPKEMTTQNFMNVFGEIKVPKVFKHHIAHLKYSVEEDYQFLNELETLKAITAKVQSGAIVPDSIVDFYNFRFRSLHALSDFHGPNSAQTNEAKKLLDEALQELCKAFVKAYDGSVLVTTIVADVTHTRRAIRSPQDEPPTDPPPDNQGGETVADTTTPSTPPSSDSPSEPPPSSPPLNPPGEGNEFDADYPAIFNIMLWFGVVYIFTFIAIVYAIMDMDPGRDSIIYRMTNYRNKKDN